MANLNCQACDELRESAPDFVVNDLTNKMCTSLENDTGLNPSAGHTDCDDLHDANDCLVGRMAQEIEMYEVCDWKDYMKNFVDNIYNVLKAIICAVCGIWKNIHSIWERIELLCKSIDNILNLIQGNKPKNHFGEWTDWWKERVAFNQSAPWSWDNFHPTFRSEINEGAGCEAGKCLLRFYMDWTYTPNDFYPKVFSYTFTDDLEVGQVIATIPMSAVVPGDMPEWKWKDLLRSSVQWEWGTVRQDTILKVDTIGYVIIDGQEFNPQYAEYGENTMVVRIHSLIGPSKQGVFSGSVAPGIRSVNIDCPK